MKLELTKEELKKIERVQYNIERRCQPEGTIDAICNLSDLRIKASDYKNIYTSDGEKAFKCQKPKILTVGARKLPFINDLYTKEFYQTASISKEKIVELFFENKVGIDLKEYTNEIDFDKVKKEISKEEICDFLVENSVVKDRTFLHQFIEQNYNKVIKEILVKTFKEISFSKLLSNHFFNNTNIYLSDFIDVIINSIIPFIRKNNMGNFSSEVIRLIFSNILVFSNNENFGICYKTKKRIAEELMCSQRTVQKAMDKLEYMGIIDYVVADKKHFSVDLSQYLDELDKISKSPIITAEMKKTKQILESEIFKQQKVLEFPCINWNMLIYYLDNHVSRNKFRDMHYEFQKTFKKFLTESIIEIIRNGNKIGEAIVRLSQNIEKSFNIYNSTGKPFIELPKTKDFGYDVSEMYSSFIKELCVEEQSFDIDEKLKLDENKIDSFIDERIKDNQDKTEFEKISIDRIFMSTQVNVRKMKDIMTAFILLYNKEFSAIVEKENLEEADLLKIAKVKSYTGVNKILEFIEEKKLEKEFSDFVFEYGMSTGKIYVDFPQLLNQKDIMNNQKGNMINNYIFSYVGKSIKESLVQSFVYENKIGYSAFEIMHNRKDEIFKDIREDILKTPTQIKVFNYEWFHKLLKKSSKFTDEDRLRIQKSVFPIDEMFRIVLLKSNDKSKAFLNWYQYMMNRNKSIVILLNKLNQFLKDYENFQ